MMTNFSTNGLAQEDLLRSYMSKLAGRCAKGQVYIGLDQPAEMQQPDFLMRSIVEQSVDGIMAVDEEGSVRMLNEAACSLFRGSKREIIGRHLLALLPDFGAFRPTRHTEFAHLEGSDSRLEGSACRLDKTTFPIELALRNILVGEASWLIVMMRDITVVRAHEGKLRHLALHDTLTGLPNRLLLKDRLDQGLRAARRSKEPLTLAILDLDRFKEVNDTLGHHVGDALLVGVAKRLVDSIRDGDTVARLGGDEFAILLPQQDGACSAYDVAERIVAAIREPFSIAGCAAVEIGVSIGLAMFPEDADSESKLMECADVAMYDAKRSATAIQRYDPTKDINSIRTLVLSGGLRQAMDCEQLYMVFQPKLDLRSSEIKSFEVLTRWNHPAHGLIPPDEFIPQAEQSGNIVPFTRWTLERTLACLAGWQDEEFDLNLTLNLSPRSLHSKEILLFIGELLVTSGISSDKITLEMTETALMLDPEGALASLKKLRDLGIRLSIDDFGTGYSSLSLLRQLPLNEIKIDRSFIENMTTNPQDQVIVASTVSLAHNLGLEVVAEGVETKAQMAALRDLGCDMIQGFYVAEPISGDDLVDWTKTARWPLRKLSDAA